MLKNGSCVKCGPLHRESLAYARIRFVMDYIIFYCVTLYSIVFCNKYATSEIALLLGKQQSPYQKHVDTVMIVEIQYFGIAFNHFSI